jgi:hypothetical protein
MNHKTLLAAALVALLPLTLQAAVQAGDPAPDFKAQASLNGKEFTFSLQEALKGGPVVVYFYPSAYTQGCNVQAHTFAEQMDQFKAAALRSLAYRWTASRGCTCSRPTRITAPASWPSPLMPRARSRNPMA